MAAGYFGTSNQDDNERLRFLPLKRSQALHNYELHNIAAVMAKTVKHSLLAEAGNSAKCTHLPRVHSARYQH